MAGPARLLRSTPTALVCLAALYLVVILAGDARAYSGSDAGGKAATVAHMVESGSWDPDVGYWAASADPEGRHHPLVKTTRYEDRWVQVTSLPMVYAAVPLWSAGGAVAALALPAAGGLLAAWGARRLALALGAERGWGAFWLVGAGSPVLFYVADLWEHAPALGLAVAGLSVLVDVADAPAGRLVLAGAAVGLAATIRAEVALYLVTLAVVGLVIGEVRRAWLARWPALAGAGVAAVAVVAANSLVERAVLATGVQADRVGTQVDLAGAGPGDRLRDAAVTTVGLLPDAGADALLIGAAAALGAAVLGARLGRRRLDALGLGGAVLLAVTVLVRVVRGLGFVPGTFPAAPMAAAGVSAGRPTARTRLVVATALGALVPVWLLQWRGDLLAQWGGRYTLLTGVLLTVVAAVAAERAGWRRPSVVVLVAATVVVTLVGAGWHVERTRGVAAAFERFGALADGGVLVTTHGHLPREGGAWYPEQRWLRAAPDQLDDAVGVAAAMGERRIVVVEPGGKDAPPAGDHDGFEVVDRTTVAWLSGTELVATTYVAVGT